MYVYCTFVACLETAQSRIYIYIYIVTTTTMTSGWLYIYMLRPPTNPSSPYWLFRIWWLLIFRTFFMEENRPCTIIIIYIYDSTERSADEERLKTRERPIYYNMYLYTHHIYNTVAYMTRTYALSMKTRKIGRARARVLSYTNICHNFYRVVVAASP